MTCARLAAVALASVLLAAPAAAADGEVLINQAKANAGGVTPGDEPGYPITISRPGKYKLTSTLRVPPNTHGIDIASDDVTIDFNGFTMGGGGLALSGINASGQSSVAVMNGTIVAFTLSGVSRLGDRALIENMRILGNGFGGLLLGHHSRVSRSIVSGNATRTILHGIGCGVGCLIEQSIIADNRGPGVQMLALQDAGMVLGNIIMSNAGVGIDAGGGPVGFGNNTLTGNNGGGEQVAGNLIRVHPNACLPTCPSP
jgi:hypothetical protein